MERNTSIAQRPHAGIHNSMGHTPGVHDCIKQMREMKYTIQLLDK